MLLVIKTNYVLVILYEEVDLCLSRGWELHLLKSIQVSPWYGS